MSPPLPDINHSYAPGPILHLDFFEETIYSYYIFM